MNYRTENKGISTIQKSPLRGDLEGLLDGDAVYIARLMLNINPDDAGLDFAKPAIGKVQVEKENPVKVYPNPAKFFFSVEYDLSESEQALLLKITDAAGRTIEQKQLKNKRDIIAINCSKYAKGNYNCIIFEGQKLKQMAKFVIE